ncbi:WD40-repeat-containing domain protein [Lentinula aciculospora]|uniref:WD40-repeat-containing domain protein n=1 Tax=Lentinula aciculospora TaxID=153920 RepID=A0A9W9A614_9AGAR|nr:WD40-repeat-containing domain protein [Lentinula aciculospora]
MDDFSRTWIPPQYNVSRPPILEKVINLNEDPNFTQNFARITKWSPDGSFYLSQCENRSFQLGNSEPLVSNTSSSQVTFEYRQPASIVDFAWYPTATPKDPATFCFVASIREFPVKLLDASDGRLRASYPIIDHRERFIAPQSLTFNLTAQKLYCGFENAIEIFNVAYPGQGTRLATTPNKSSKDGLKGLISALAFCPSYESDMFAAGSLNANGANISLFSESQGEIPLMFLDGVKAGVMQLQFNPIQPYMLYASFRRDTRIFCWDIRYNSDQPFKIYAPSPVSLLGGVQAYSSSFKESTNQKHRFDIDISGKYLSVGRQNGDVLLYELDNSQPSDSLEFRGEENEPVIVHPTVVFPAHEGEGREHVLFCYILLSNHFSSDSIGSVAFHPTTSRLLSTSGSRNFDDGFSDSEDSTSDSDDARSGTTTAGSVRQRKRQPLVRDNSLKLWKF